MLHTKPHFNKECENLLNKKITELKSIIKADNVECSNLTICSVMRKAIWKHYENKLDFSEIFIDISSGEDTKKIWQQLSNCLPIYFLFQSDRSNTDGDKEVQDPMKAAVAQFLKDTKIQETLNEVAEEVLLKLNEVSERTLEKLKEMDEDIAENLKPVFPSVESLKWADVFKNVSITSDDNIPINKRGSGVKRLILLNFFRAEAERRQEKSNGNGIIYAIEEPETSQHFANQRLLAKALISLANTANTQVIMTTHSGVIVKTMDYLNLRLVKENENKCKTVYFLNIQIDGADTMSNIYSYYTDKDDINYPSYMNEFQDLQGEKPDNPVIMLFDNELNDKKRPIAKFCKSNVDDIHIEQLKIFDYSLLCSNLYLMVTPLTKQNGISDIEDLFEKEILDIELDGKKFCKADKYDIHKFYGKDRFSKYIVNNYKDINFDNFRPLLDNILKIKKEYNKYKTYKL